MINSVVNRTLVNSNMDEKEAAPKHKGKKNKEASKDTNNVVQIFEITVVFLMLFLVFTSEFALINVHVFHSTIAWLLMMFQGLLVFRQINPVIRKTLGRDSEFVHWVLETIALVGATLGFLCAYQVHNEKGEAHFITWHGLMGLIGYGFCLLAGLNGIPTLYRKELKNYYPPQWNKLFHFTTGTLGVIFGGSSLVLALSTNWFNNKTSSTTYGIALFLIISVVTWVLIKPVDKIRSIWRKLMNES